MVKSVFLRMRFTFVKTSSEDVIRYGDPDLSICMPSKHEASFAERITAYDVAVSLRLRILMHVRKSVENERRIITAFKDSW